MTMPAPIPGFSGDVLTPGDAAYDEARHSTTRRSGGAFARKPEDATPLGRRDAAWHWQAGTAWFESADDERSRAWIASVGRALAPWSGGETYPNFIVEGDPERLRAAFAPAVFERLQVIRTEWDPDNLLGAGHAIPT
jgi:hypothetical protein